jgi:hypothetical protein
MSTPFLPKRADGALMHVTLLLLLAERLAAAYTWQMRGLCYDTCQQQLLLCRSGVVAVDFTTSTCTCLQNKAMKHAQMIINFAA